MADEYQIVDLTTMCLSFPESCCENSDCIVPRDNIISTIDKMFDNGIQVIGIEGEEGIGRTTLLVQYAKKHNHNTFSLFIKPTSRWGFDPIALQYDICNQLSWFFYERTIDNPDYANDVYLRNHLLKLQHYSRIYKKTFVFVIDGLEDLPTEAQENRNVIIDMLPFGVNNFKFLISADPNILPEQKRKGLICKPFPLVEFGSGEVEKYFSDISIGKEDLDEIFRTCKGVPGKLSSIKRILKSGVDISTFVNDMPNRIPDLFEFEWSNIKYSENLSKILSILVFDDNIHNIKIIAKILSIDEIEVSSLLSNISFVCVESNTGDVSFVSNGFRSFAANKLFKYKDEINRLIIDYLVNKPESEENLKLLPLYLNNIGEHLEVIKYLSPDRFEELLSRVPSLYIIEQMAKLGLDVSEKLDRDGDIIRFGLHCNILKEFKSAETWRSQVEALMALKDYNSALILAQTTFLKEERLHLLAIIARKKKEHGLMPEPELLDQIKDLYNQIDIKSIGEKVIEIASDLLFSLPDIAVELIEKAGSSDYSENSLDWAFASLSIQAISQDNQFRKMDLFSKLNSKISNPILKKFSTGANLLLGNYSIAEVIAEVEKLESTGDRLYLLCQWVIANRKHESAFDVIDYALKLTLKTTEYAPNAKLFKELSFALPYITDKQKVQEIIYILDSQKQNIEHNGPTEDYVIMQLLLAEAETKYNISLAKNRMIDLYLYIGYIADFDTRINCLARYVSALQKFDPDMYFNETDNLHTLANEELNGNINLLLASSADHFNLTQSVIFSLGMYKPEKAFETASSLNVESRRDHAYNELIESYLKRSISKIDLVFVKKVIDCISDNDIKSESLLKYFEKLASDKDVNADIIKSSLPIINEVEKIPDLSERCRACCLLYNTVKNNNIDEFNWLCDHLLELLKSTWNSFDVLWIKKDVGYKIAEAMADNSIGIAKEYLQLSEDLKDSIIFHSSSSALTYITCIRLAARAYSGLLPKSINTSTDYERLANLISQIPSHGEQLEIWSNLALYCYVNNKITEFYKVYNDHVKPLLDSMSKDDISYTNQIKTNVAPTIYLAHKLTAFDMISKISMPYRDFAYFNICEFLIYRKIPYEPYDEFYHVGEGAKHANLLDVCEIIDKMEDDSLIYYIISNITDCILSKKATFSREQQTDIASRLTEIINRKFPSKKYITHDGYKIVSEAQVCCIQRNQKVEWDKLIEKARNIPNDADKAYVLCILANILSHNISIEKRKEVVNEAYEIINSIPSTIERIYNFESLCSLAWNISSSICKDSLTMALKSSFNCKDKKVFATQRRIIDLAYRLDPDLASSFASISDDDIARNEMKQKMKRNIKHRYLLQNVKKNITDHNFSQSYAEDLSNSDYIKIAWMMLKSLNSGRSSPIHVRETREYIKKVSGFSLIDSYPVYSWVIQNAIRRLSTADQSSTILRPIFDAALMSAEFAKRITLKTSKQNKQTIDYLSRQKSDRSIIIRVGERESALHYIREWIEKNIRDYFVICDPYFGIDELEILKYVNSASNECQVKILTSIKHLESKGVEAPWQNSFKNFWRMRVSDQSPPNTVIYVIGTHSQKVSPFHDRWWLTKNAGLRLGTSLNTLGITKSSEISVLSEDEAKLIYSEVEQYISMAKYEHNGERIEYNVFTLT